MIQLPFDVLDFATQNSVTVDCKESEVQDGITDVVIIKTINNDDYFVSLRVYYDYQVYPAWSRNYENIMDNCPEVLRVASRLIKFFESQQ